MNYATPVSIYGMLPAHAEFVEGRDMAVYKNGKRDAIISWDPTYVNDQLPVSYMYVSRMPQTPVCSVSKKPQLINGPFDSDFFKYSGEAGRHLREYRNFFGRRAGVKMNFECDAEKALDLIRRWEIGHGRAKYGMIMHSSYDKRFFKKSLCRLGGKVDVLYFTVGGECVGYKVLESKPGVRPDGLLEFRSMLRKYDPAYSHICLYVDIASYEYLFDKWKTPFCVNVGCSSGGVARYKMEKFPVMEGSDHVFFCKNTVRKEISDGKA